MKLPSLNIGLVSTASLLGLIPPTLGIPRWFQSHERGVDLKVPRQYSVYETSPRYGGYTYAGYGPQPTVTSTTALGLLSSTSQNSGETFAPIS
jgi:hypothetical protein